MDEQTVIYERKSAPGEASGNSVAEASKGLESHTALAEKAGAGFERVVSH